MKWTLLAVAALLATVGSAAAGEGGFISRDTRIAGCIAIVDDVRNNVIGPTEWLEANKEEFRDLQIELKRRKFAPAKAKEFLMGMAISLCMERKGYSNKCIASGGEDGDVQMMATAHVYACWRRDVAEAPRAPPPPPIPCEVWNPACNPPQARGPALPPMSPADVQQFNEDMGIITSPPTSVYPVSNQGERFASCASYWQSLSYNRSPEARQVLYSVRVARCMYRTGFAFRCPMDFGAMLQPSCYARF
jgi:hypothetical protein